MLINYLKLTVQKISCTGIYQNHAKLTYSQSSFIDFSEYHYSHICFLLSIFNRLAEQIYNRISFLNGFGLGTKSNKNES